MRSTPLRLRRTFPLPRRAQRAAALVYEDVEPGKDAILELRELYGDARIDEMRRVKRELDPAWKLAPGVIFTR